MTPLAWLELGAIVVLGTAGQLALKLALRPQPQPRTGLRLMLHPLMLMWFGCYIVATLLWLHALRTVPLSQAFPILGLQFAFIPIAAARWLREPVTPVQWIGVAVIVAGVALVGQS